MLAVIFRAQLRGMENRYIQTSARLRQIALEEFGCREFISFNEGNSELAISYWDNEEQILAWKQHPEHRAAQQEGMNSWYSSYQVQVVEVLREYSNPSD